MESNNTDFNIFINKIENLIKKYDSDGVVLNIIPTRFESIILYGIKIPKEKRNTGIGTQIMNELISLADKYNIIITLSPGKDFGSSYPRLVKFYKRFGFKDNKGRYKDFRFSQSMIREPKNINENRLNEVGDASGKSFNFKITDKSDVLIKYAFTTDSNIPYKVIIDSEKLSDPAKDNNWQFNFGTVKKTYGYDSMSTDEVVNKGEVFKVMATIIAIFKDFIKRYKNSIDSINFKGSDDRRDRMYAKYISNIVGNNWNSKFTTDGFILTPKKQKQSFHAYESKQLIDNILKEYKIGLENDFKNIHTERYSFIKKSDLTNKKKLISIVEKYRNNSGAGLPIMTVSISRLIPTQKNIDSNRLTNVTNNKKEIKSLPFVVKLNDKFYLLDGHHRVYRDKQDGKGLVNVRILDLDRDLTPQLNNYCSQC